jgi:hypothetical protein
MKFLNKSGKTKYHYLIVITLLNITLVRSIFEMKIKMLEFLNDNIYVVGDQVFQYTVCRNSHGYESCSFISRPVFTFILAMSISVGNEGIKSSQLQIVPHAIFQLATQFLFYYEVCPRILKPNI